MITNALPRFFMNHSLQLCTGIGQPV